MGGCARSRGRLGGGGGDVGGGGGAPMVQCNGRSSCERRSPLFPTPGATQKPCFSLPGSSHFSNIHTGPVDSHNANTQLVWFMYAHRQTHTLVCTQSVDGVSDGDRGGWVGVGGGNCGSDFRHFFTFVFVLKITSQQQFTSNMNVL